MLFENNPDSLESYYNHPHQTFCDLIEENPFFPDDFWRNYFIDYDHYNATGHEFVMEILFQEVLPIVQSKNRTKLKWQEIVAHGRSAHQ